MECETLYCRLFMSWRHQALVCGMCGYLTADTVNECTERQSRQSQAGYDYVSKRILGLQIGTCLLGVGGRQ